MPKLVFDANGLRFFETGVSKAVLFRKNEAGTAHETGVPWNGVVSVTESPEGAEESAIYADNMKYLSLRSPENLKATIEAFMYPDAFEACDGSAELSTGVKIGQQAHREFALAYQTKIGNDQNPELGYKIHIIYGATAAPSERAHATVNESPEAMTMSWELSTTPVAVAGHRPTAHIEIDSTKISATALAAIEAKLYGSTAPEGVSTLLTPDEILTLIAGMNDSSDI